MSVSKTTTDREPIIRNVVDAIDHHLVPMAGEVAQALSQGPPPQTLTIEDFVLSISGTLTRRMNNEREADIASAMDEFETEEARLLRDDVYGTKVKRMRAYRNGLEASYGEGVLSTYGLRDTVPNTPHRLVPYADNVATRMEKRPLTLTPRAGMPVFDTQQIAAEIRTMTRALEDAINAVNREVREDQLARARRDQVRASSWRTYQALATVTEGLFRLIDRADLADRVRLTSRRRAGLPEVIDLEFEDQDEPAAPTPADPALEDA